MAKANKLPVNKINVISNSTTSNAYPKPDKDYEARERKFKAQDALNDIERAETHKRDKGLMKDVKCLAKDKIKSLGKI